MNILDRLQIPELLFQECKGKDKIPLKCCCCETIYSLEKRKIQTKIKHNKNNYCSQKCYHNSMKLSGVKVICVICGKGFEKSPKQIKRNPIHCCSLSCVSNYRWRGHIKKNKKCINSNCNNHIHTRNKNGLCQSCFTKQRLNYLINLTLNEFQNELSVKGKHPSWINSNVRNLCRSANSNLLELPCQSCGYDKHTEFSHIKAVSSFNLDTKIKIVNSPDNLLMLCPNCHWEFDNGLLQLEQIKPRLAGHSGLEPDFSTPSTAKNLEDSPG